MTSQQRLQECLQSLFVVCDVIQDRSAHFNQIGANKIRSGEPA